MTDDPVIDVDRLVEDVRRRVADVRARGGYGDDVGDGPLHAPQTDARIRFRPELSYSSKPVVGPPLTAVKRVLLRLNVHAFDDLARQVDQAVVDAEMRLDDLLERVEGIEATLQRLQLGARLARLERAAGARSPAPASPPAGEGPPASEPVAGGLDYLVFEGRFRGP